MSAIVQPDSLLFYGKKFSDYIREHGPKPYFYSTWAREKVPQYQETISAVYSQAASENDAGIVNFGAAWELAKKYRPNIELYSSDGSHPSDLGAFLTACAFVREFCGELPETFPEILPEYYDTTDKDGEWIKLIELDKFDVIFCAKVANEIN